MWIKFDAFLCHRRSDGQLLALAPREHLRRKGLFVFMDVTQKKPGRFWRRLEIAIRQSRFFVVIATPHMFGREDPENDWVRKEMQVACDSGTQVVRFDTEGIGAALVQTDLPCLEISENIVRYTPSEPNIAFIELARAVPPSLVSRIRRMWTDTAAYLSVAFVLYLGGTIGTIVVESLQKTTPKVQEQINDVQESFRKAGRSIRDLKEQIRQIEEKQASTVMFLIDTTGSMHRKLPQVARHAAKIASQVQAPNHFIVSLFADYGEQYVVREWSHTNQPEEVQQSIISAPLTYGGDPPEALADALQFARLFFDNRDFLTASLVVFTDAPPHPPSVSPTHADFRTELDRLLKAGIRVTLVHCHVSPHSIGWDGLEQLKGVQIIPLRD